MKVSPARTRLNRSWDRANSQNDSVSAGTWCPWRRSSRPRISACSAPVYGLGGRKTELWSMASGVTSDSITERSMVSNSAPASVATTCSASPYICSSMWAWTSIQPPHPVEESLAVVVVGATVVPITHVVGPLAATTMAPDSTPGNEPRLAPGGHRPQTAASSSSRPISMPSAMTSGAGTDSGQLMKPKSSMPLSEKTVMLRLMPNSSGPIGYIASSLAPAT